MVDVFLHPRKRHDCMNQVDIRALGRLESLEIRVCVDGSEFLKGAEIELNGDVVIL